MSKRPPGGSAAAKKGQSKDPNVLYPARPVPIPSPLPEAKRVTASSHNLGYTEGEPEPTTPSPLIAGRGHGPSENFPASANVKLASLTTRIAAQQAALVVATKSPPNQSRRGSALPAAVDKASAKEPPAKGPAGKNGKAPPSASTRGKAGGEAKGAAGAAAVTAAATAAASKQPPLDPDLVRAIAATAHQVPHPSQLPFKLGRPPTPPVPRRLPIMENQPTTKTHPVSASLEWRYQAATDARDAAETALALEQAVAFEQSQSSPRSHSPHGPDSEKYDHDESEYENGAPGYGVGRSDSATCMTVAERKWRELLAWEDAQADVLRHNFSGSVDAFMDAAQQCIDDFTKEQARIGQDIEGLCDRITAESVWWSRERIDRHMVVLRELVEEDAGIKGEVEHTISWLQEDSAGHMADTVDAFREKMLAPMKPGYPEPDGLAALLPVRARNLQILSHRELVRGSSLLLQARRELIPRLLAFDVVVTHRFHTFVAPVVKWVRQEWPKERARAAMEEFHDFHARQDWARDLGKQIIGIVETSIHRCQPTSDTNKSTEAKSRPRPLKKSDSDAAVEGSIPDPSTSLPIQLNQAVIEDAARAVYRALSQAQNRLTETVTDACQEAVNNIVECVEPWAGQLIDDTILAQIAEMLNLSSPSEAREPWWIGRSLAGRVRRVDWQFFIASLRRTAISALEEFSDNARVCRRYAKSMGDLWASQRAEIERVIRNMDNQLAESQHAHDEDAAGLRSELDKAIDRMMHAETEVECSHAYEVVKAVMSDLETLYSSRARHVSTVVSGADEGTVQRFTAFQQRWNELLPPTQQLADGADKRLLDLAELRTRIAEFERTRRPTQVGFVERLMQANSNGANSSSDTSTSNGNRASERSQGPVIAFSGISDGLEPSLSPKGKGGKSPKKGKPGALVTGPIAIDFQRPSNVRSTTPNGTSTKAQSPPGSPMGLGLGLLALGNNSRTLRPSSSGVESFSLNSPLGVADDVQPLEFQLEEELDQARKLISELVRHPIMALHVAVRDMCQTYRTEFANWHKEMTSRLAQMESSSVFRAGNQLSTQAYSHERRGKVLHQQFTQKLLSIQATKLAIRKQRKEREQQLVDFAGRWRSAVELAEGLLHVYIQRVTNGHVPDQYTNQAIGKQKRFIERLVHEGSSEVEKTIGPLSTQWNETATQMALLAANLNADDLRPYSPDPIFSTSGAVGADGLYNPAVVATMTPELRVSAISGIEGKSAEVSVQVREGIHRITRLKHRLQEAAKSATADLDSYFTDLEMANRVHTAIVQCKTRVRSLIAADQTNHVTAMDELKALAEQVRTSLGTQVAFVSFDSTSSKAGRTRDETPPPTNQVVEPAQFWEQVAANIVLLVKAWDLACQRATDIGDISSSTTLPAPTGFGADGGTGVPSWAAFLASITDPNAPTSTGKKRTKTSSKRRGYGLLSKGIKSPTSLSAAGSPSSSRSGSRLNLLASSTPLPQTWIQQLTAELAKIPFTVTPRRNWFGLQRTWVTVDNLVAANWSWTVECESRQLVAEHQSRCAREIHAWLQHQLPSLANDLIGHVSQQVNKWMLRDWALWTDKWAHATRERLSKDTTRREYWDTKVRRWRPEPTATVDEIMGTAVEWTARADAENKTWVSSTIDALNTEVGEDAASVRRQHAQLIAYSALVTSPLTFASPSAAAATLVDVCEWMHKQIPSGDMGDFEHVLVGMQKCAASVQVCADTETANNAALQARILIEKVGEIGKERVQSVSAYVDSAKAALDRWWAGWTSGLEIVVQLSLS